MQRSNSTALRQRPDALTMLSERSVCSLFLGTIKTERYWPGRPLFALKRGTSVQISVNGSGGASLRNALELIA